MVQMKMSYTNETLWMAHGNNVAHLTVGLDSLVHVKVPADRGDVT